MDYKVEILNYVRKNRVSTTEVADALGKSGVLAKVLPVNQQHYRVGPVKCIFTANESNWDVHEQIRDVQPGEIVIVFAHNCEGRAILGDLIAKYILLYREAEAIVVCGWVRDVAALRRENFAIWSEGVSPLGCFNIKTTPFPVALEKELRQQYEGGLAVCDDGGVVVIPQHSLNSDMLNRLHRIEMQEDIWFFCLDSLKWDTKKIVCDKAYLKETDLLSSIHIEKLNELNRPLDVTKGP